MRSFDSQPRRCAWAGESDPLMHAYHDEEWGVPEYDDRALYEKLILDGFQAGLSWRTILHKRAAFRKAFKGFEPHKIARYTEEDIARLLDNPGIVRSRSKIEAAIGNARIWIDIMEREPGGFSGFLWAFTGGAPKVNRWKSDSDIPAKTPESEAMAKALKARGFKFCGPVIVYAFMQAVGMVNDHVADCHRYKPLARKGR